jgi:hypothetical protein
MFYCCDNEGFIIECGRVVVLLRSNSNLSINKWHRWLCDLAKAKGLNIDENQLYRDLVSYI